MSGYSLAPFVTGWYHSYGISHTEHCKSQEDLNYGQYYILPVFVNSAYPVLLIKQNRECTEKIKNDWKYF